MLKLIQIVVGTLIILSLIILFTVFKPYKIQGPAMAPNYSNGDTYITNKLAYTFEQPQRGDVVVYNFSQKPSYVIIGRVVGLPGEKIMIKEGKVYLNGHPLNEKYLPSDISTLTSDKREFNESEEEGEFVFKVIHGTKIIDEGQELQILDNHYFMMGDSRGDSVDSRDLGLVEKKNIKSKVLFKYSI